MSTPFLNDIGRDYAHETLRGSVFMHEGQAYTVDEIPENRSTFYATNLVTSAAREFDSSLITGWKMFKYPKLGYRSFNKNSAAWLYRNTSYNRGLNASNLRLNYSPFTRNLSESMDTLGNTQNRDRLRAVVFPEFHTKEDLVRLFSGEIPHVVLNEDVLIELPVGHTEDTVFDVYYRDNFVSSITEELKPVRVHNAKLIERIIERYVA